MLTIVSTLVSFLMGGLPKIFDFLQDRSDKKHELQLAQMQTEREMQLLTSRSSSTTNQTYRRPG